MGTLESIYSGAVQSLNEKVELLREDMEEVGVARGDLKTIRFSVNTRFRTVQGREVFQGYEASHDLEVHLPLDREILNRVLMAVSQSGSRSQFRLSFGVRDETPLRQEALEKAVAAAKQNATTLARAAGISLGSLVRIEYGWTEVRVRRETVYNVCESSAAPDITPEDVSAEDSVVMVWEIAPGSKRRDGRLRSFCRDAGLRGGSSRTFPFRRNRLLPARAGQTFQSLRRKISRIGGRTTSALRRHRPTAPVISVPSDAMP